MNKIEVSWEWLHKNHSKRKELERKLKAANDVIFNQEKRTEDLEARIENLERLVSPKQGVFIDESRKKEIKKLREEGLTYRQIAARVNIGFSSVGRILNQ